MDEDVTKLTDEELDKRLEEPTEETTESEETPTEPSQDEPSVQEEPVEEESEPVSEEEPAAEQSKEEEPKPPSRRETLRIQQILAKRESPQRPQQQQDQLDYKKSLDADPEVIKQLEADRNQANQQGYNQGLEQAKTIQFHTRLDIDAPRVESKYKFLDKNSTDFDPVRANALNSLYLNQVGYEPGDPNKGVPETVSNPSIRYAEFVEAQMEFAEALMSERNQRTVKNVAKQAAQTGLRPDGSSAKSLNLNKAPQAMTDEELDAYLKKSGYGG